METIEPRSGIKAPEQPGHKTTEPPAPMPGTALRLDLKELFEGDPSRLERFAERLWRNKTVWGDDGCWLFLGTLNSRSGYGIVKVPSADGRVKTRPAHRVAFALAHDVILPAGALVRRVCANRHCINPAHLYLGDYNGNRLTEATGRGDIFGRDFYDRLP